MFLLFFQKVLVNETGYQELTGNLNPGQYEIECYGAQGGNYCEGNQISKNGGAGAYAYAKIKVENQAIPYRIEIGEKGKENCNNNINAGSRPDGGDPGATDVSEIPGGGGGSTRVILNNNYYIVAAGGSGATSFVDGSPGGGDNYCFYKAQSGSYGRTNDKSYMTENRNGEKGGIFDLFSDKVTGSGGGGGCLGGKGGYNNPNSLSVGVSGSSCIISDNSFIKQEIFDGLEKQNFGNGRVIIKYEYSCPSGCETCSNENKCGSCKTGYYKNEGKCVENCDSGYYQDSSTYTCTRCTVPNCKSCSRSPSICDSCTVPNCNSCKSDASICESCSHPYVLSDNEYKQECPASYFNDSYICKECIKNCSRCDNSMTCSQCYSSHVLYKGKCEYTSCPPYTYQFGNECIDCPPNCEKCSYGDTCDLCKKDYFQNGNDCINSCGDGYYQDSTNRKCTACDVLNCKSCPGNPSVCDSCKYPFVLHQQNCGQIECPSHYFNDSFICKECSKNCLNCSSMYNCTSCKSAKMRINKKGNCTNLITASYDDLFEIQPVKRKIQKNRNSWS